MTRITLTSDQVAEVMGQEPNRSEVQALAAKFAAMNDDLQAQFFIEVASIATEWEYPQGWQWFRVGSHLRNCDCSTYEARDMVEELNNGLEHGRH